MESAASRVFAIPELVENIIKHVAEPQGASRGCLWYIAGLKDIYMSKRISRAFSDVIAGSSALQQIMSIGPRSWEEYCLAWPTCISSPMLCCTGFVTQGGFINFWQCNFDFGSEAVKVKCGIDKGSCGFARILNHAHASWKDMQCVTHGKGVHVAAVISTATPKIFGATFDLQAETTLGHLVDVLESLGAKARRGRLLGNTEVMGVEITVLDATQSPDEWFW